MKHRIRSRVSLTEILDDFKSLEDLANSLDIFAQRKEEEDNDKNSYKGYLQLKDFRRPKLQECVNIGCKFIKLNRSYSLQEMRENGLQLTSTVGKLQSNTQTHSFILSEFIL